VVVLSEKVDDPEPLGMVVGVSVAEAPGISVIPSMVRLRVVSNPSSGS